MDKSEKMQTKWKVILIISIIVNLILMFILSNVSRGTSVSNHIYIEKIDSLEEELNVLHKKRDSIRYIVDTITIKINTNNENYEKALDTIFSNSVDDDYLFFTEYIEQNKSRFYDSNND